MPYTSNPLEYDRSAAELLDHLTELAKSGVCLADVAVWGWDDGSIIFEHKDGTNVADFEAKERN